VQESTQNTVEQVIFDAFKRIKLIEGRETSNYHRCGRTDKGKYLITFFNKKGMLGNFFQE